TDEVEGHADLIPFLIGQVSAWFPTDLCGLCGKVILVVHYDIVWHWLFLVSDLGDDSAHFDGFFDAHVIAPVALVDTFGCSRSLRIEQARQDEFTGFGQ